MTHRNLFLRIARVGATAALVAGFLPFGTAAASATPFGLLEENNSTGLSVGQQFYDRPTSPVARAFSVAPTDAPWWLFAAGLGYLSVGGVLLLRGHRQPAK